MKKKNLGHLIAFLWHITKKKTKNDVRCVAPVVRTPRSKQHLLSSFSGMRPISATACEWTHGDVGTHQTPMRVWTLRAHDKRRRKNRNHISPLWKWKQIKATHLYTTKDRKSEEKRCLRRENLGILIFDFFFFSRAPYSYRFNPMDYILFVPLSL